MGHTPHHLLEAVKAFDFQEIERLVKYGVRCDDAFLKEGETPDNHEDVFKRVSKELGCKIETNPQLLFEVHETLLNAGHEPPDGSRRHALIKIIGGAEPARYDRACALMKKCLDHGMLDWRTSQWAIEIERKPEKHIGPWTSSETPLANPDELFSDAIAVVAQAGNLAMLKMLGGVLPEDIPAREMMLCSSRLATQQAVIGGSIPCLEYLFSLMPEARWKSAPLKMNATLVELAATRGHEDMLRWLVGRGVEVNVVCGGILKNIFSATLEARQPHVIPVLLELGGNPHVPDGSPGPLQVAIAHGFSEYNGYGSNGHYPSQCNDVIEHLIKGGAGIEQSDMSGMTPLLVAGMVGNREAAGIMIKAGANMEARDGGGRTAILWAVENDRVDTFEVLHAAGAKLDVVDIDGNTIAMLAKERILERLAQIERDRLQALTPRAAEQGVRQPRM